MRRPSRAAKDTLALTHPSNLRETGTVTRADPVAAAAEADQHEHAARERDYEAALAPGGGGREEDGPRRSDSVESGRPQRSLDIRRQPRP